MTTRVYGASDDLIEFEGDIKGEVCAPGTDERAKGVLLIFSDGTILEAKYGKGALAIWVMRVQHEGTLFDKLHLCMDEHAEVYSDIAQFKDGLWWAISATDWQRVE